jgi:2'-5' RNA ligase superfamily
MSSEPLHVCLVPLRELGDIANPWLEQSMGARPSHGVPPHVTLLFPCPGKPSEIGEVLANVDAFDVDFREIRRFPDVAYLAPDPAEPFAELTCALWDRFPEWPPYGGAHAAITPHLTIAWHAKLDEAEAAITPLLPLRARAREAVLLRQEAADRWEPADRFPFQED